MSKFKLILILFVAPFLIEAQEGNVAEIFMDTSYNLDFGSSLYNDLSYFFANVSPDGRIIKPSDNGTSQSVERYRRGVHWDNSPQFSREYPVIKWAIVDKDSEGRKESRNITTTDSPFLLTPDEENTTKALRSKTAKKRVYVVEDEDEENEDEDYGEIGTLSAPTHETSGRRRQTYHHATPQAQHYPDYPPPQHYPADPYYNPRVSYAQPRKTSSSRNNVLSNRPYQYIQGPGPIYTNRNNPSEKILDVGVYPKNLKWIKSIVRPPPQHGHGGYGPPPEEPQEIKRFPQFLLPWPFGFFIPSPVRRLPTLTLLVFSPIILIPFAPFGMFEFRLPWGWDGNYLAERFYGFEERADTGRGFADDQSDMFYSITEMLSNTFAINGKACLQRLICELAEVPIKDLSLMAEFLHFIVDPRKGKTKNLMDYQAAEKQGMLHGNCSKVYSKCPFSIRRLISEDYVNDVLRRKKK